MEQHLVPEMKADPRGCGKVVNIKRLERRLYLFCSSFLISHA